MLQRSDPHDRASLSFNLTLSGVVPSCHKLFLTPLGTIWYKMFCRQIRHIYLFFQQYLLSTFGRYVLSVFFMYLLSLPSDRKPISHWSGDIYFFLQGNSFVILYPSSLPHDGCIQEALFLFICLSFWSIVTDDVMFPVNGTQNNTIVIFSATPF